MTEPSIYNFNTAGEQRSSFDVIPSGTICDVQLVLKIHLETEDGWLRLSKGGAKSLDCEFTVLDGEYAKRKIWALLTMDGPTPGHAVAADISRKTVRAMLESARGIRPDDKSAEAEKARLISDWGDLNGLCCVMRVGVKPAEGEYRAKNTIWEIITPERQGWHRARATAGTFAERWQRRNEGRVKLDEHSDERKSFAGSGGAVAAGMGEAIGARR